MVRVARFSNYLGYTYPEKVPVVCQSLKFNWAPSILSATLAMNLFRSNHIAGCMLISNISCTEFRGNHRPLFTYPLSPDTDPSVVSSFLVHKLHCLIYYGLHCHCLSWH